MKREHGLTLQNKKLCGNFFYPLFPSSSVVSYYSFCEIVKAVLSRTDRTILYTSAKTVIDKKTKASESSPGASISLTSETCDGLPNLGADSADDDTGDQPFQLDGHR